MHGQRVAGAIKCTGTDAMVGGGGRTGAVDAAKRTRADSTVGGGTHTGTGASAGMYMSSRGSAETSLTPAASSSAMVLGD